MKIFRKFTVSTFLLISVNWLSACAASHETATEIRSASLRSGICTLHHVPLESVVMYDFTEPVPFDLDKAAIELWRRYPNSQPEYAATKRPDRRRPITVRACPVCERLYRKALERLYASPGHRRSHS